MHTILYAPPRLPASRSNARQQPAPMATVPCLQGLAVGGLLVSTAGEERAAAGGVRLLNFFFFWGGGLLLRRCGPAESKGDGWGWREKNTGVWTSRDGERYEVISSLCLGTVLTVDCDLEGMMISRAIYGVRTGGTARSCTAIDENPPGTRFGVLPLWPIQPRVCESCTAHGPDATSKDLKGSRGLTHPSPRRLSPAPRPRRRVLGWCGPRPRCRLPLVGKKVHRLSLRLVWVHFPFVFFFFFLRS
jgi:hypothetical protein